MQQQQQQEISAEENGKEKDGIVETGESTSAVSLAVFIFLFLDEMKK